MRTLLLFAPALLCAQLAAAEDRSQEDFARQIEAKFANKAERVVTHSLLEGCELMIEHSYIKNCSAEHVKPQQASKAAKTVWQIDLTTVKSVRVSPVHGDTHVGLWPARNNRMSKIWGRPARVKLGEIVYHCNGDAYEQEQYISADVIVSKPVDPEFEQLLTDYINDYCK